MRDAIAVLAFSAAYWLALYLIIHVAEWAWDLTEKRRLVRLDDEFCQSQANRYPYASYDRCMTEQEAWRIDLWARRGKKW